MDDRSRIPEILRRHGEDLIEEWTREMSCSMALKGRALPEEEVRRRARKLTAGISQAASEGGFEDLSGQAWSNVHEELASLSLACSQQGLTPSETAGFLFSLKKPLFSILCNEYANNAPKLAEEIWGASLLLDELGIYTMEVHRKGREDLILRQQQEMTELAAPVIRLWAGVLAVPLIGTLDGARAQVVTESLLQQIVNTGASIAIIDMTGVPTVDTLVAQQLLKTVAAARLLGAECIISGIRPQIAQTVVHLEVDLGGVVTKASLADALAAALVKTGFEITRQKELP
ncbi:MAG: STAS domain-containing protein [Bryobacteraceae bacterium]